MTANTPISKDFKPWHKPRKQWIRREQWCKEVETLIPKLILDGRPLRYLSLPGEDMLDIRIIAKLCEDNGLNLKCLGYDEGDLNEYSQTEVNISWNEVSNNIEPTSTILSDNISVLKNANSQAFKYVKEYGPFDVINLDFCGPISCINHPDYHHVLNNLCEYQNNNSRKPWLLFLTTRAEYEIVNIEHLPHYLKNLKSNAVKYEAFGKRLSEITKFNIHEYGQHSNLKKLLASCPDRNFVKLFSVGLGKWLLRLMIGDQSSWKSKMLDSCWYRVGNNHTPTSFPNMLSLTYYFTPVDVQLNDPSGLVKSNPQIEIDEESLAMGILEKTDKFVDLDIKIDRDKHLFENLITESTSLLKAARYSVKQYPKWVEQKTLHFASTQP